ncbi:MAG: ABC transporter substrate-binding protein [Bacteroidota bacterium]
MNKFLNYLGLGLVLLCFTLALTSCGGPEPEESTFKYTDNTVRVRLAAEPDRLSPFLTTSGYARPIYEQIFLPLLEYNKGTFAFTPALAKARPTIEEITEGPNAGGIKYTYELYDGATFQDGQPVTVEDVIFTFKIFFNYNIAEAAPFRPGYSALADVVADPDNPLRFSIISNEKYILAEDTYSNTGIYPKHIFDPAGLMDAYSFAQLKTEGEALVEEPALQQFAEQFRSAEFSRSPEKLIGAGPYRLTGWEDGQYITLTRVDNWWADAVNHPVLEANPDSIVFKIIKEQATAVNALRSEEVDLVRTIDAQNLGELKENEFLQQTYNFHTPSTFNYYFVALNNKEPRLSDKRVRRALAHVIDVQEVIDQAFAGLAARQVGPISPKKASYNKDLQLIERDYDKAAALLSEAGWEDTDGNGIRDKEVDGERMELDFAYLYIPGGQFGETMAQLIKDGASRIGVNISLEARDIRTLLGQDVANREYDMYGAGAGGYHMPDDLMALWHTSGNVPRGQNRWQFGNEETDALIEKINQTLDAEERNALYREFQEIVYDEQPLIFLFAPLERMAISKRFENANAYEVLPNYNIREFKLAAGN